MQNVIGIKKTLQVLHIFPRNLLSDKNLANEIVHSKCVPSNASLYHITFSFFIQITFFRTKVFSTFVKSYWKRFFRLKMKWNLHKGREKIACPIICIYILHKLHKCEMCMLKVEYNLHHDLCYFKQLFSNVIQ